IGGVGRQNQATFEFRAQPVDSVVIEVISVGYVKTPTAGGESKCPRGGHYSLDEVASRVPGCHSAPSYMRRLFSTRRNPGISGAGSSRAPLPLCFRPAWP